MRFENRGHRKVDFIGGEVSGVRGPAELAPRSIPTACPVRFGFRCHLGCSKAHAATAVGFVTQAIVDRLPSDANFATARLASSISRSSMAPIETSCCRTCLA